MNLMFNDFAIVCCFKDKPYFILLYKITTDRLSNIDFQLIMTFFFDILVDGYLE